ncbi:MAG: aminoacyl-tRNA deacylase, partial [Desulfovibrio sp.]|nr:aminoacyl-tRNA deacylase [Desulfovibrio sp.]
MSTPRIPKTNAARLLETLGIPFELHTADVDESDLSAVTLARRLGADPACVFKTLVARGDKTGVLMACIPAAAELDLKALAAASGNKHAEMVPLKDVRPLTGYVRGGCSPLGVKKAYPV